MKKQFFIMTDEKGFIFPYVLFVISLALIILTASVQSYQSEIRITHNQSEQLKVETLMQMSKAKFASELSNQTESDGSKSYEWPYGNVEIEYIQLNDQTFQLQYQIKTDNDVRHTLHNQMKAASE